MALHENRFQKKFASYANADYLVAGDSHFFTDKVKSEIKIRNAREFLDKSEFDKI